MSAPPTTDRGAEREIDLARWRTAILKLWWIPLSTLIGGAIVGALYGVAGGSIYQASVLIAPAQPFGPNGNGVLNYISTPRGISALVDEETTLKLAARAAGVDVSKLRSNVTVQTVPTGVSLSGQARGTSLIKIIVQLPRAGAAEAAATKLGSIVKDSTESTYVRQAIASYATQVKGLKLQQVALQSRIAGAQKTLNSPSLSDVERFLILSSQSNSEQLLATIDSELATAQQSLVLAQTIELAQVVGPQPIKAVKTTARSRRTSILFGAIIGLILGLVVAIVVDTRASRARRA